jgi:hypothetical protein
MGIAMKTKFQVNQTKSFEKNSPLVKHLTSLCSISIMKKEQLLP